MRLLIALFVLTVAGAAAASEIGGKASVVDGDTIVIGDQRIRLYGIDAPESGQTCSGPRSLKACGKIATDALSRIIGSQTVTCEQMDRDRYGRVVATCRAGNTDISESMVAGGYALAFAKYSSRYVAAERQARAAKRGLWQTTMQAPWTYYAVCWTAAQQTAPKGCPIRGNINRAGEHIYHTPFGSTDHSRNERWSCSEDETIAAHGGRWSGVLI